jgi:hypothetical protein
MNGNRRKVIALAGVLALVVALNAVAGEKRVAASDTPRYDVRAEHVIKAKIAGIKTHESVVGYQDMHVVLSTTVGDLEVHLGPASYLAKRGIDLKAGDEVVVTGCKTTWEDQPVIVARHIKAGNHSLTLRSTTGKPAWPKNLTS